MNKRDVVIIGSSIVLIVAIVLGVVFGCSTCTTEEKRLAALEAQRLEAERLAAEEEQALLEAQRLEAERLAAEEAARLEALRKEAQQAAAAARWEAERNASASNAARQAQQADRSQSTNPLSGVWTNDSKTIVFRLRDNLNVEVLHYDIVDESVEVYWRTNRALTGGGFYDTRNPETFQSIYTGTGTFKTDKGNITFELNLKNHLGTTKNVTHTTKYTLSKEGDSLRFTGGLARKFIINKETRKQHDTKDFVTSFIRQ